MAAYVDFALKTPGLQRHRFVRELFALSRRVTSEVFGQTLERALRYRIVELSTLQRIAWNYVSHGGWSALDGDDVVIDEGFRDRPAYREGGLTDEPGFSRYEAAIDDQVDDQEVDDQEINGPPGAEPSPDVELDGSRAESSSDESEADHG